MLRGLLVVIRRRHLWAIYLFKMRAYEGMEYLCSFDYWNLVYECKLNG